MAVASFALAGNLAFGDRVKSESFTRLVLGLVFRKRRPISPPSKGISDHDRGKPVDKEERGIRKKEAG